jgi:hypothetical protein
MSQGPTLKALCELYYTIRQECKQAAKAEKDARLCFKTVSSRLIRGSDGKSRAQYGRHSQFTSPRPRRRYAGDNAEAVIRHLRPKDLN